MRKILLGLAGLAMSASPAMAGILVSGSGVIYDGRTFTINARVASDGTVTGHATLINHTFSGDSGHGPYQAHIDISCAKRLDANTVILGGLTTKTNDSNLQDAVYFAVQDNGKGGGDRISFAYFYDDDPNTTGDPALCSGSTLTDLPLEDPIVRGNVKVR